MFSFLKNKNLNKLKLVYDDDLIGYLKSVDLYDKIIAEKFLCIFCGNNINLQNLEMIIPRPNKIDFVCSNRKCLNQL